MTPENLNSIPWTGTELRSIHATAGGDGTPVLPAVGSALQRWRRNRVLRKWPLGMNRNCWLDRLRVERLGCADLWLTIPRFGLLRPVAFLPVRELQRRFAFRVIFFGLAGRRWIVRCSFQFAPWICCGLSKAGLALAEQKGGPK